MSSLGPNLKITGICYYANMLNKTSFWKRKTKTENFFSKLKTNNIINVMSIRYNLTPLSKSFIQSSNRSLGDLSVFYDYKESTPTNI